MNGEMKILDLFKSSESKTLEFKRGFASPQNLLKTLVTFANIAGGRVVIGCLAYGLYSPDEIPTVDKKVLKR